VSADEERTAIGDHRENEHDHHFTSYPLMEPRSQSKLLILYSDRVLMTHSLVAGEPAHNESLG
jgi:hypothetical protein